MILVIDNYDSFTYNIVQYLGMVGAEVVVRRNDEISVASARHLPLDAIVISPGPGTPKESGCILDIIHSFAGELPILGICLGHQAIGVTFGARLVRAPRPVHGKSSVVRHDGLGVYQDLPPEFSVGRYHSLVLQPDTVTAPLVVTATSLDDGQVMGIRHAHLPIEGVQFHPESIATTAGLRLLRSFVGACPRHQAISVHTSGANV
jgi:anthranilate synthase/aminodeoxychorismate synthase-like glutamine amidotransferase